MTLAQTADLQPAATPVSGSECFIGHCACKIMSPLVYIYIFSKVVAQDDGAVKSSFQFSRSRILQLATRALIGQHCMHCCKTASKPNFCTSGKMTTKQNKQPQGKRQSAIYHQHSSMKQQSAQSASNTQNEKQMNKEEKSKVFVTWTLGAKRNNSDIKATAKQHQNFLY